MEKVTALKQLFLYLLLVILIVGGLAIYYLMRINYKPILSLKRLTEKFWKDQSSQQNELGTVQSAFEYLNNQNTELHARLDDYSVAAKEHFMFQLIKGQFQNRDSLQHKAQSLGLTFSKEWFRIVILHLNQLPNLSQIQVDVILQTIENALPPEIEGYARDHLDQKNIVLVMASDELSDSKLEAALVYMQTVLMEKLNLTVTIGVGEAYQDISQIPLSYIESMTAIDYRLVKGTGQIIFSKEFVANHSKLSASLPLDAEKLKMFIKQGDNQRIDHMMIEILNYLKNDKPSLFEAKMIGFELINTVVHTIEEMNKLSGAKMDYPDVFLLFEYETVDELAAIVKKLSYDISVNLQKMKDDHKGLKP